MAFNDFAGLDRDVALMPAIRSEEMRRRMVVEKHPDGNAVEQAMVGMNYRASSEANPAGSYITLRASDDIGW